MRTCLLLLLLFFTNHCFAQNGKDGLPSIPVAGDTLQADSAIIVLEVIVNTSGKAAKTRFVADSSTSYTPQMIEIAERKAREMDFKKIKTSYKQQIRFVFTVTGEPSRKEIPVKGA